MLNELMEEFDNNIEGIIKKAHKKLCALSPDLELVREKTELMLKEGHDDFDEAKKTWFCTYKFDNDSVVIGQYSERTRQRRGQREASMKRWQKWVNNGEPIA